MRLHELIEARRPPSSSAITRISKQQALDRGMFGPVYHGTTRSIDDILANGFDIQRSIPSSIGRFDRPTDTSNGMPLTSYGLTGIAPPIHFLGFGVYFTTVKAIAKRFNGGSGAKMYEFYIDAPEMLEINFGSENTMMKWWRSMGYDMTSAATTKRDFVAWVNATKSLTATLRPHGAVWFKGKGGTRVLLDGDQICVYDTKHIHIVDPALSTGLEVGSKVVHTGDTKAALNRYPVGQHNQLHVGSIRSQVDGSDTGWTGVFRLVDFEGNDVPLAKARPLHHIPPAGMKGVITNVRKHDKGTMYDVRWSKGGTQYNYVAAELKPI